MEAEEDKREWSKEKLVNHINELESKLRSAESTSNFWRDTYSKESEKLKKLTKLLGDIVDIYKEDR